MLVTTTALIINTCTNFTKGSLRDRAAKQYPEWDSKAQKAFDMLNKHYYVDHARLELEMSKALETKDPTVKDQEFWTICSG